MSTTIKKSEYVLPYGTTADNIAKLLDAIKNKHGDDKGIKATYSGSKYETTQAALEALGIISGLTLTSLGKSIAFEADESKKKKAFLKAVLGYAPYEYFLSYITQGTPPAETELETLKNYWGRNNYGTANNRSEAAPVCFSILQLAGLGEYIIGRKGKNTRFVWVENYAEIIKQTKQDDGSSAEEEKAPLPPEVTFQTNGGNPKPTELDEHNLAPMSNAPSIIYKHASAIIPTNIEIKVDMTEWDLEKISAFLKIINIETAENEVETV